MMQTECEEFEITDDGYVDVSHDPPIAEYYSTPHDGDLQSSSIYDEVHD